MMGLNILAIIPQMEGINTTLSRSGARKLSLSSSRAQKVGLSTLYQT
jgi:hypothetical protein